MGETGPRIGPPVAPPPVVDPKRLSRLRISLRGVGPAVWRAVVVAPETTFDRLPGVIQAAMGWHGFHLHRFGWTMRLDGRVVGDSYWETLRTTWGAYPLGPTPIGAIRFRVCDSFVYEYDMGDRWVHDVRVEKKPERKGGRRHPWVAEGGGAGDPRARLRRPGVRPRRGQRHPGLLGPPVSREDVRDAWLLRNPRETPDAGMVTAQLHEEATLKLRKICSPGPASTEMVVGVG